MAHLSPACRTPSRLAITPTAAPPPRAPGQDSGVGTNAAGLRQFLAEGGGILMGAQAWYWNYSKPLPDHPSNQLLTPLGIVLSGQYLTPPTTLAPTAPPSQLGNADVALACLNASCAGDTGSACYSTTSGTISGYTATCAWTDDYIPEGAAFWTTLQKVWGRGAVCGGGGWGGGGVGGGGGGDPRWGT